LLKCKSCVKVKIGMKRRLILILSLGLVLGLNIYFRTFPINFPQLKSQARNTIEDKIYQDITKEIDKQFPEINKLARSALIKSSVSKYMKNNKLTVESEIQQEYLKLKDKYQDTGRQTYLMELDCWHWARYTENVYRLGHPGDQIINSRQKDNLMLAPFGTYLPWNHFLFYFSAWLYKIFSLIFSGIPIFTFLFYLPLFFVTIFIIVLYLFCFYRWGNLCAALTCIFVGLSPAFLSRSYAGWFDMDIFNLFFPFLICWTYIKAYDTLSFKSRIVWLCFSAFCLGLFCFTWVNWWFILFIIVAYEVYSSITLVFYHYHHKNDNIILLKRHIFTFFLFLVFSLFWIVLYSGVEPLRALYSQIKGALVLNSPLIDSIWPNVFFTVGELRQANLFQIADNIGSPTLFILSFACLSILFLRILRNPKYIGFEREFMTILVFWFVGMLFACSKGERFSMFLLIPLGIGLGRLIGDVYRSFKEKKQIAFVILMSMLILNIELINNASSIAKRLFPMMDDTSYKVLIAIGQKTPKDAVINSWWDFGDWFKAVSHRRVIFDGQSQNIPQAYWMANVLLSSNEKEAIGILRMLNNGGNKAFEIINQHLREPFLSVLLLKRIIGSDPQRAKEILLKFLPSQKIDEVIRLIFGKPQSAYFVVDYTMLNKIYSISFLGNWDFTKVYLSRNLNKKDEDKALDYLIKSGIGKQEAERFYQEARLIYPKNLHNWISHPVRFYSKLIKGQEKDNIILFDNGMVYNPEEKTVYLYPLGGGGYKIPKSLFLFNENRMEEITYPNNDLDYSALVFKAQDGYQSILLDHELANCIFVRLYFLEGNGLLYFKPLIEEKDENNNYIRVFEIIWS